MEPVEIIFLGVNDVGERIYEWLLDREDAHVIALLTHEDQLDLVDETQPDLIVTAGFRQIVPADILEIPDRGAVNFHKSYLPYNRGANPNVWSIVEDNPAGVSLHYMTANVDAGPIIDRRRVPVEPDDTGRSLYNRLENEQVDQFIEMWPAIRDGTAEVVEQDPNAGSYHYKREFVDLWEIDREANVQVGEFLDRLRALTFPPYRNAYFERGSERYYVEITITTENRNGEVSGEKVPEYSEESEELP